MASTGWTIAFKILLVFLLFAMSAFYTNEAMISWEESPTVTSASWMPLKDMPFPALTICPLQDSRWTSVSKMMAELDPESKGAVATFRKLFADNKGRTIQ